MFNKLVSFSSRNYSNSRNSKLAQLLSTMPKEQKHIAAAQKQRKKIKEKSSKYSPGRVTLQVLGTGAKGAPHSLYVFSDQSRYLFNCGEGTQRLAHEHKMKLAKLEHIFITQPNWDNIGGLPGAALTIQDVGVPEITLHGPQGLEELFIATRRFVVIKDLQIKVAQCGEDTFFEDNVLKVKYVPIEKRVPQQNSVENIQALDLSEDETDYYKHETSGRRSSPKHISNRSKLLLQEAKNRGISMAYICQLQPRPGALCLEKCVEFGVPAGPLLGKLKSGEDVTLADGKVVKASDVCDPDDPGPIFIVVDCPTKDYLDSLIENEVFYKHQATATRDEDVAYVVVHFSPENVLNHPKYQDWVGKFIPSTQHLAINELNSCMGSLSVHRIQYKLNLLSKEIFPLLGDRGTEIVENETPPTKKLKSDGSSLPVIEDLKVESPSSNLDVFIRPNTLFNHHLRPRKGCDKSVELKLVPSEFIEETMSVEKFPDVLQQVRRLVDDKLKNLVVMPYPKVIFLGTGSSIPNKTRNTSAIVLEVGYDNVILLDCGEGTYGQLVRFYGQDDVDGVLTKLRTIYISHLHADHHLGLIGVLQGRRKAFQKLGKEFTRLTLLAPKQIFWWLNFYDKCFETILRDFELVPNTDLLKSSLEDVGQSDLFARLGLREVSTCFVRHCPNAFGVSLTVENGKKITYSGDTMPSDNLVELGDGSDLLIHEATMEDELADEAVIKMHSTTSQAIEIGRRMNAKFTLLTHFSQRYAKLPRFNENFAENVGIAFDNMQIKLDELPLIPLLYPAMKLMFAEHYEELEHKAAKRQLRIEREKELIANK